MPQNAGSMDWNELWQVFSCFLLLISYSHFANKWIKRKLLHFSIYAGWSAAARLLPRINVLARDSIAYAIIVFGLLNFSIWEIYWQLTCDFCHYILSVSCISFISRSPQSSNQPPAVSEKFQASKYVLIEVTSVQPSVWLPLRYGLSVSWTRIIGITIV